MTGDDAELPKGRTIPINGARVRTLRIQGGWPSTNELAEELDMSEDRLIQIEKGGAKVYAKTLIAIAKTLGVHWKTLLAGPLPETPAAKPGKRVQFVIPGTLHDFDEIKLSSLIEKARQISGIRGEIIVITVEEGNSVVVTVQMSEEDYLKLLEAYRQGKLKVLRITRLTALPDAATKPSLHDAPPLMRRKHQPPKGGSYKLARYVVAASLLLAVGLLGLAARQGWLSGHVTPAEAVSRADRLAKALANAPPDAPAVEDLRREALRLRLESYDQFAKSEALKPFLERTRPQSPAGREAEFKTQLALLEKEAPAGLKTTKSPYLFQKLPPGLRPGAEVLYADMRRQAGDISDPALTEFLLRARRPGDRMGMIIPAFWQLLSPDGSGLARWDQLIGIAGEAARSHAVNIRLVILKGWQSERDVERYQEAIARATDSGIDVLGYVNCDGGLKPFDAAMGEVAEWHRRFPGQLRGIFFDNQSPRAASTPQEDGRLPYFTRLYQATKTLATDWQIVACPIRACDEEYFTQTDLDVVCMVGDGEVPSPLGWEAKYDPARFAAIIRRIDRPELVAGTIEQAAARHFGCVYVTDSQGFPRHIYHFLPEYLPAEIEAIRQLNQQIGPAEAK